VPCRLGSPVLVRAIRCARRPGIPAPGADNIPPWHATRTDPCRWDGVLTYRDGSGAVLRASLCVRARKTSQNYAEAWLTSVCTRRAGACIKKKLRERPGASRKAIGPICLSHGSESVSARRAKCRKKNGPRLDDALVLSHATKAGHARPDFTRVGL